jgi:hypothetical protein
MKKKLDFFSHFLFHQKYQKRYFSSKILYNQPLDMSQILTVTPARPVPTNIERPDYASMIINNYNEIRTRLQISAGT